LQEKLRWGHANNEKRKTEKLEADLDLQKTKLDKINKALEVTL
jgi:hypothetical protein